MTVYLKTLSVYSLELRRQRKLKYKKNFNKRFHRNIHEFTVSRPQKTEKYETFLIINIRDINRNSYRNLFSEIQCFSRSIRSQMFLKNTRKLQNTQELNAGVGVCFLINLQAEYQQPYLKETPGQICFCVYCKIFQNIFSYKASRRLYLPFTESFSLELSIAL